MSILTDGMAYPFGIHEPVAVVGPSPPTSGPGPSLRSRRVLLLLVATAIMCMVDLALTLTYVTSVGMVEVNPVARAVMALGSPAAVALWKIALTAFSVGVLFRFRATRTAEIGAWAGALVMLCLSLHWARYVASLTDYSSETAGLLLGEHDHRFVVMAPE